MGEYKKSKPKLGVSLEKETANVPSDGRYHLVIDGSIVFSTAVLTAAEIEYSEYVERRSQASREILSKEQDHYSMQAVRSDSFTRRSANAAKRGGRGGRGGV